MEEQSRALTQPLERFKERSQRERSVELNPQRCTSVCLIGKVEKGIVSKGNCHENDESTAKNGSLRELQKERYVWI